MTVRHINERTSLAEVLAAAGDVGVLIEPDRGSRYAVIPLDDDLIDYLLEKNPNLRADCLEIRDRMKAGQFKTHAEVRKLFAE